MKKQIILIGIFAALIAVDFTAWSQTKKPRLIVLADMGNEPDEMLSKDFEPNADWWEV